jgi:hypothetical protein
VGILFLEREGSRMVGGRRALLTEDTDIYAHWGWVDFARQADAAPQCCNVAGQRREIVIGHNVATNMMGAIEVHDLWGVLERTKQSGGGIAIRTARCASRPRSMQSQQSGLAS